MAVLLFLVTWLSVMVSEPFCDSCMGLPGLCSVTFILTLRKIPQELDSEDQCTCFNPQYLPPFVRNSDGTEPFYKNTASDPSASKTISSDVCGIIRQAQSITAAYAAASNKDSRTVSKIIPI